MKLETLYKQILDNDYIEIDTISSVPVGYSFYKRYLKSLILNRYKWSGLPLTISDHILESMLIENGAVIPIEKNNNVWIQPLNAYGVGVYPDEPPKNIYSNPVLGSDTFDIDWYTPDNAICFENKNHYIMQEVINRYSMQLSRIDSCIDIILANNNGTEPIISSSQNVADGLKKIYDERLKGKYFVPVSEEIVNILGESFKIVEGNKPHHTPDVIQLITVKNNILRQFLRCFGINSSKDKTQAILSDENEVDNSMLLYSLDNGLQCRKEWATRFNLKYGTSITVEINEYLKPKEPKEPTEPTESIEPKEPTEPTEPKEPKE